MPQNVFGNRAHQSFMQSDRKLHCTTTDIKSGKEVDSLFPLFLLAEVALATAPPVRSARVCTPKICRTARKVQEKTRSIAAIFAVEWSSERVAYEQLLLLCPHSTKRSSVLFLHEHNVVCVVLEAMRAYYVLPVQSWACFILLNVLCASSIAKRQQLRQAYGARIARAVTQAWSMFPDDVDVHANKLLKLLKRVEE